MKQNIDTYQFDGIRVAVVDDHEVVLEGYRSYLQKLGVAFVEAFTNANALLNRIQARRFDVFIVDVELPDLDVSTLIDGIRKRQPEAKILISTIHDEMWVVSRLVEEKVDGVMYKTNQLEQLQEALIAVLNGQQYYCQKFRRLMNRLQLQNEVLTKREIEVVRAIARGLSTKEIARQLFISENTVETHRQNIFEKLGVRNMAGLIIKAIAGGYISVEDAT
ncbi:MAG: response regulator transcription factor [Bacteroidaceae bacterium]|nr:response regulator transcription factor [Bacteroidaceae bacterium]MBR1800782.1 response regulator transcription factor [Bacteroidaceae bacterium]